MTGTMTALSERVEAGPDRAPGAAWTPRRRNALALVAVVGVLLRIGHLVARHGVIGSDFDAGVYYGATGLMVTGYRPYVDFAFLHPPGILLLLAPIAWLGEHLIGHAGAFALASVLSAVVAGGTILGIGILASWWRGPTAGIVAALLYATFLPAIRAEGDILLEPFVNAAFVGAALIWLSPTPRSQSRLLLAGAVIALTSLVKLTGAVVGLGCLASGPFRRRSADRAILFAAVAGLVVVTIAAFVGGAGAEGFLDQILVTQVGRPRGGDAFGDPGDATRRLGHMLGVGPLGFVTGAGPSERRRVVRASVARRHPRPELVGLVARRRGMGASGQRRGCRAHYCCSWPRTTTIITRSHRWSRARCCSLLSRRTFSTA